LERASAPFGDQLEEAAIFIGVKLDIVGRAAVEKVGKKDIYHGREEWLLRWLLKKLQSKDGVSRYVPRRPYQRARILMDGAEEIRLLGGYSVTLYRVYPSQR